MTDPSESAFGLQPNIAAGLASLFSWVGGLVILLGKPPQAWVRFVAVQAIVLAVSYAIVAFAFGIMWGFIGYIPGVRLVLLPLLMLAYGVLGLAAFIAWIVCTVQAFSGKAYRLPVLAEYADRFMPTAASL